VKFVGTSGIQPYGRLLCCMASYRVAYLVSSSCRCELVGFRLILTFVSPICWKLVAITFARLPFIQHIFLGVERNCPI